jgi:peptide/nickel transport system permease protein
MNKFSLLFKFIYILLILFGFFIFRNPNNIYLNETFCSISINHIFGCDRLGRDILTLFCYGSFVTLILAIPSKIFSLIISLILSLLSYSGGRFVGLLISSLSSVFLSIPSLLIALVVIYSLGKNFEIFLLSIVLSDWAMSYETIHSKISEISNSGYVYVSKNFGASNFYVFKNHIFPDLIPILNVLFVTGIPSIIMTIAIYSYMGINFGSDTFGPGLGEQISFSRDYFHKSPLSVVLPIIGIFLLVNVFNFQEIRKKNIVN